jgi:Domain of unknown function (DUF4159)
MPEKHVTLGFKAILLVSTGSKAVLIAGMTAVVAIASLSVQRPFREYPAFEYYDFPKPPDWQEKSEWVFARLMYPSVPLYTRDGRRFRDDWQNGMSYWTMDYPRSDRHFAAAVRRLTRIHGRSVEQPVNPLDEDDIFNYPYLYSVEPGHWDLTEEVAAKLRQFLLRGGFLMVDDFHGTDEWRIFTRSLSRIFPDRIVVDLPKNEAIFHVLYDLDDKYQVPGAAALRNGVTYEFDGFEPRWRGVYDDKGRVMVAICHNMDLGDSWELADDPQYPEKYSALGIRIGVNYVIYAMTH